MIVRRNGEAGWHTRVSTVLGELTLVRGEDGIRGLYFPRHGQPPTVATLGPHWDMGFAPVIIQLEEYLARRRREFDLHLTPRGTQLEQRVWDLVREVPYATTITCGALVDQIGADVTTHQVGTAVARNPLSILVPCHRVVGADGELTGYAGGLDHNRQLLDLEQLGCPIRTPADGAEAN